LVDVNVDAENLSDDQRQQMMDFYRRLCHIGISDKSLPSTTTPASVSSSKQPPHPKALVRSLLLYLHPCGLWVLL